MHPYRFRLRAKRPVAEHHIDDLLEVLDELLDLPDLRCFEPDEVFGETLEVIAKARCVRSAVLDELAPSDGGL